MVDIPNHEDSLRELSKTSLVNNATIILCWSAAEAARYLELYKSYESANFAAIRGQQSSSYADRLVDFVTVPRSLNKSDAVALVANFGSLRNAINADAEQLGMLNGWGGVKVKRWSSAVEEPFRAKKAAKRGVQAAAGREAEQSSESQQRLARLEQAMPRSRVPLRDMPASASASASGASGAPGAAVGPSGRQPTAAGSSGQSAPKQFHFLDDDDLDDDGDDEEALLAATLEESQKTAGDRSAGASQPARPAEKAQEELAGGVAAALAKLRENG